MCVCLRANWKWQDLHHDGIAGLYAKIGEHTIILMVLSSVINYKFILFNELEHLLSSFPE